MKSAPVLLALVATLSIVVKPLWLRVSCIAACTLLCVLMVLGFFG